jgi:hypothetical protein
VQAPKQSPKVAPESAVLVPTPAQVTSPHATQATEPARADVMTRVVMPAGLGVSLVGVATLAVLLFNARTKIRRLTDRHERLKTRVEKIEAASRPRPAAAASSRPAEEPSTNANTQTAEAPDATVQFSSPNSTDEMMRPGSLGTGALLEAFDAPMATTPPEPLTDGAVRQLFVDWCRTGRYPTRNPALDRTNMRLTTTAIEARPGTVPTLEDSPLVAEFVRVGETGATDSWLLPNPDSRYTPLVSKLFPMLGEDWEQSARQYEAVVPLHLARAADGSWQATQ